MFAVLSDMAGLPGPLVIGSSFRTFPDVNSSTGQNYPRVVEFDAYPGYDGYAQYALPANYVIQDCKKIGIYASTEGKFGLCVCAPGIFFPETERNEPRDSWFIITCGEVLLAQVQTMGVVAGVFSGTLPTGEFGEDYHPEDENEHYQDRPDWESLTPEKQILLDYAISQNTGGIWDILDTTQPGDPDVAELEVNPQMHPGHMDLICRLNRLARPKGLEENGAQCEKVGRTEGPEEMLRLPFRLPLRLPCLLQTGLTTDPPVFVLCHLLLLQRQ